MKDAFVAIHGHFYQPPRENPWLEVVEREESAHPFHDWNERITFECYRPNGYARIVDGLGKILDIVNNYSFLSFNFGPTLLSWIEREKPLVYQKIIEADRESLRRLGHGNAIAQVYDHLIMPLANDRDREAGVRWGVVDFERRFHRKPEAMWLPETAVNYPTLEVLIQYGMRYLILSPFQALRVKPLGGRKWTEVQQGKVDTTQAYRCFLRDRSGKKTPDRYIDLFFYDGSISKEIAFDGLLKDGNRFCDRFARAYQPSTNRPQLIHISTDGETYGHHKKFGEMALAYALKNGFASRGLELTNYGAFLKRFPPVWEAEIDQGSKGEGTSWSCAHGVGRWKEDCGCSTGGKPGWNQKWREPLREALDLLRDEISPLFEREGEKVFNNPWEARNGYIDVILDRSPENVGKYFEQYGVKDLDERGKVRGLKLMEMERHALRMYTSCGWFFADLGGLETRLVLQHAARAIQLSGEFSGQEIERKFLQVLSRGRSNLPEMGDGAQIYHRFIKPTYVTPEQVVNHYAITSIWDGGEREKKLFCFRVEKKNDSRMERSGQFLLLGRVRITSDMIPDPEEFLFGLISSKEEIFRIWVSRSSENLSFKDFEERSLEGLKEGKEGAVRILTSLLGGRVYTLRDALREERQEVLRRLVQKECEEYLQSAKELFDKTTQAIDVLIDEGQEIPFEMQAAAEVTLSDRLLREVMELRRDFRATAKRGAIDRIIEESKRYGYRLNKGESLLVLNEILREKMEFLRKTKCADLPAQEKTIEEMIALLDLAGKWGFDLDRLEAQDLMHIILEECVRPLEAYWWGDGSPKPFPPLLLTLAAKLDFSIEKIS
jgi:alpha-amylase/alpha-mannosidase (GH57 family)